MWILTNWRLMLIVFSSFVAVAMTSAWRTATAQRDLARADLANYKRLAEVAATTAKDQSDHAIQEINRNHETLLDKTKNDALKNYLARYGSNPAACRTVQRRMQPGDSLHHGEAGSAEVDNGAESAGTPAADFLERAAKAAVMIYECQQFVTLNHLPVSKE